MYTSFCNKDLNLRKARWLKFLKDYNITSSHRGKVNVVVDALSHCKYLTLSRLLELPINLCEEVRSMELNVVTSGTKCILQAIEAQLTLIEKICVAQATDPQLERIREEILVGKEPGFVIHEDGTIRLHNQVCVLAVEELKKKILDEGHNSQHLVHPVGNKFYKNLKPMFRWSNMKQEVANYVTKCLTCPRVKMEHQRPVGLLQPLEIPKWKWDSVSMDFAAELPLT